MLLALISSRYVDFKDAFYACQNVVKIAFSYEIDFNVDAIRMSFEH